MNAGDPAGGVQPKDAELERIRKAREDEIRRKQNESADRARLDRKLIDEAPSRWQPDIDPASDKFAEALKYFRAKVQDESKSAMDILNEDFSPFERKLFVPADSKRNPALAMIQTHNENMYTQLLRSTRFAPFAPSADLAFKLTLLY